MPAEDLLTVKDYWDRRVTVVQLGMTHGRLPVLQWVTPQTYANISILVGLNRLVKTKNT